PDRDYGSHAGANRRGGWRGKAAVRRGARDSSHAVGAGEIWPVGRRGPVAWPWRKGHRLRSGRSGNARWRRGPRRDIGRNWPRLYSWGTTPFGGARCGDDGDGLGTHAAD